MAAMSQRRQDQERIDQQPPGILGALERSRGLGGGASTVTAGRPVLAAPRRSRLPPAQRIPATARAALGDGDALGVHLDLAGADALQERHQQLHLPVAGVHFLGRASPLHRVGGDGIEDPGRGRRGHIAAEARLLQHQGHHDLGCVAEAALGPRCRSERREPGEVRLAQLLRRAGLARHRPPVQREVDATLAGKVERLVCRSPQEHLVVGAAREVVGRHAVEPVEQRPGELGAPFELAHEPRAELSRTSPSRSVILVAMLGWWTLPSPAITA